MQAHYQIFIRADEKLADVADVIGSILKTPKNLEIDDTDIWFLFTVHNTTVTLGENDFDNEDDLPLEIYDYDISVVNADHESPHEEHLAHQLYTGLQQTGRYRLLFTKNLKKIDGT